jgi:hypothetical protein
MTIRNRRRHQFNGRKELEGIRHQYENTHGRVGNHEPSDDGGVIPVGFEQKGRGGSAVDESKRHETQIMAKPANMAATKAATKAVLNSLGFSMADLTGKIKSMPL